MRKKWLAKWLPNDELIKPEPFRKLDYIFGLLSFFISFGVYLQTLNPSVSLYDAGDMITAAYVLGIPHPPGYPFYCLFGRLLTTLLPCGNIAFKMNMLSALFGSLACLFLYLIVQRITGSIIISIISSSLLAFSYTFWQQSTFAGQYIGHLTFSLLLILLILKSEEKKYLYLFSFFLGLSLTHHRQTLFVIFGGCIFLLSRAIFIKKHKRKKKFLIKPWLINLALLFILFLIPLFLYLYLPIRASANPPLNWGDPDTLQRFISHIKGEQYKFLFLKLSLKEHILRMTSQIKCQFTNQFTLFPVILGVFGIVLMLVFDFLLFILLFSIISVNVFISSAYNHPSIELYYMLPCAILSIFIGYTIFQLMKLLKRINISLSFLGIIFLYLSFSLFLKNYNLNNRSRDYSTYDYGMNILRPVSKNAVVFVSDDTHTFPTEYLVYVENARPDISLVDTHLLEFEWKANLIKGQFPDLSFDLWPIPLRKEVVTYDEVSWERQKDIISKNIEKRPFYIFPSPFTAQFYEFLPEGVFSRILRKDISKEEVISLLDKTRFSFKERKGGIVDSSSSVDYINYAVSYYNRGRLYYNAGRYKDALFEVERAIKIHPGDYIEAKRLKGMIINAD